MTEGVEIDVRETADRVVSLLERGQTTDAFDTLRRERDGQPQSIRESLDRFVASNAATHLEALRLPGALAEQDRQLFSPVLDRLHVAIGMPRFPAEAEMNSLSAIQRYDVYASLIATHGNQAANDALGQTNERVVLGLRQENTTLAAATRDSPELARPDNPATPNVDESRLGTGVYDDRIAVLWRDGQGHRHVHEVNRANTEPTAQYDAHARPGADRDAEYAHVRFRRQEGADVNADRVLDLGRMAEGTVEMALDTHANPRAAGTNQAFRPVREYADQAERDTNADGWFTSADINGTQNLNRTFKIHSGSSDNTDSAGCQTIHPGDYLNFMNAVQGNPQQTRWQYVLIDTSPGMFRDVNRGLNQNEQPAQGNGRNEELNAPNHRVNPRGPRPPGPEVPDRNDPDRPDHDRDRPQQPPHRGAQLMTDPDHVANPSWLQAERAMGLAAFDPEGMLTPIQRERATAGVVAGVLADTRTNMSRIDRVDASTIPDVHTGLPKYLIAGQGDPTTGHYRRVAVEVSDIIHTPVEQFSDTAKTAMQTREQKQVQELAQAQTINQDVPGGPTMRIGARSPGGDTG